MPEPTLSILIISYNTRDMTLECIRSVFEQTRRTPFELIVLDNASTDGSADAVAQDFADRVQLIRSPDNLGFGAGNNAAATHATGKYLLLLNPDTVVLDGAIDKLVEFAIAQPHAGIWGGRTLTPERNLNPTSAWADMTLWSLFCRASGLTGVFKRSRFFNPEAMPDWNRKTTREVDIVTGCFLLITAELWRKLGGFDTSFFMYGEEADLCRRARASGARPVATGGPAVIHYDGASDRIRADKMVRLLKAKRQLIERQFSGVRRWVAICLLLLWPASRLLFAGCRAIVGRRSACRQSASEWKVIWRRRSEWIARR